VIQSTADTTKARLYRSDTYLNVESTPDGNAITRLKCSQTGSFFATITSAQIAIHRVDPATPSITRITFFAATSYDQIGWPAFDGIYNYWVKTNTATML
jgi:hypothetical protein